jgi:hypothetical protein
MNHCENCYRDFSGVPFCVSVQERAIDAHGKVSSVTVQRVFCSTKCEEEHRKEWEVKP